MIGPVCGRKVFHITGAQTMQQCFLRRSPEDLSNRSHAGLVIRYDAATPKPFCALRVFCCRALRYYRRVLYQPFPFLYRFERFFNLKEGKSIIFQLMLEMQS